MARAGNDLIRTYEQVDQLTGSLGDDYLSGGKDSDTYIYNKGDGKDIIDEYGSSNSNLDYGLDTIKLGEGISQEDVYFQVSSHNLIIKFVNDEQNQITIKNHFYGTTNQIEN